MYVSPFTNPIRKWGSRQQRRTTETKGAQGNAEEPKRTEECPVRDEDIVDAVPLVVCLPGQDEKHGTAARYAQVRKHGVHMRSILGLSGVAFRIRYVWRRALMAVLDCCAWFR